MRLAERLGVVVLAGGRARRLGWDKATLPWGRSTLLGHVVQQFAGAWVARRVVVLNPQNEAMAREGLPSGVGVVVNRDPGSDMIASVRVGIEALGGFGGPVCVHPVDVFAVSGELVRMLYEAWQAEPSHLHLPEVRGRGGHPLILPPRFVSKVGRIPAGCGLSWLLREHADAVVRHPWDDERLLADIDTVEDYMRYRPPGGPG